MFVYTAMSGIPKMQITHRETYETDYSFTLYPANPILADDPQGRVSQTRDVFAYLNQRFGLPPSEEQRTRSLTAVASAREASIERCERVVQMGQSR